MADALQYPVTKDVAVAVIDRLEVVDVDHEHHQRALLARRRQPLALERGIEVTPVGQIGERVRQRLLA